MKIAYCTNVRLPSERAHGHQIAQVCDALAGLGHDVTIFAPFRKNPVADSYHAYYAARAGVAMNTLGTFDPIASRMFPGVTGLWMMNALLRRNLRKELYGFDLLYTRSPALLPALLATDTPTILELHQLPRRNRRAFVHACGRCAVVACLTSPMRDELLRWGVREDAVIAEGDAVDLTAFSSLPDRSEARKRFGIPDDAYIAGYAGSLGTMGHSKGVEQLVEAVSDLRAGGHDIRALVAGGPSRLVEEFRVRTDTACTLFLGQQPRDALPFVYAASDVLVYTAPESSHPYFRRDTSPLKLFEYMATGKPIIAADLPPLRDIVDEESCLFYRPGDAKDLARSLLAVRNDPEASLARAERAKQIVRNHTWDLRMQRILHALSSHSADRLALLP